METHEKKIERLEREKWALEREIEGKKEQNRGFIGAMVLCGLFLILTFGFGCQIDSPHGRY